MVTRPGESASAAQIPQWMEEDFWESVAEAAEDMVEDDSMEE